MDQAGDPEVDEDRRRVPRCPGQCICGLLYGRCRLAGDRSDLHTMAVQIKDHHQTSKLLHRGTASHRESYAGFLEFDLSGVRLGQG